VVAEKVPRLPVRRPDAGWEGGVEQDRSLFCTDHESRRDDVPEVQGNYVGGDEIEIPSLVGQASGGADVAFVALGPQAGGGLDLHAKEVAVGLDDRVITGRIPQRLENFEAVFGGGGDKL